MLCFVLSYSLTAITNGIFEKVYHDKIIIVDASGSSRQHINGSMQLTKPEYSIYPWNKAYDWCSNCLRSYDEHPWITFSLDQRRIRLTGYFIRAGCCYYDRCCCDDGRYYCAKCCLYSWSLQISEDNKTWTSIHTIEKDDAMRRCAERTYKFEKEYTARFIRLIQNEPCPGDPPCISLNRFDLYGEITGVEPIADDFVSFHDDDDDVSIIGHISKNRKVPV